MRSEAGIRTWAFVSGPPITRFGKACGTSAIRFLQCVEVMIAQVQPYPASVSRFEECAPPEAAGALRIHEKPGGILDRLRHGLVLRVQIGDGICECYFGCGPTPRLASIAACLASSLPGPNRPSQSRSQSSAPPQRWKVADGPYRALVDPDCTINREAVKNVGESGES